MSCDRNGYQYPKHGDYPSYDQCTTNQIWLVPGKVTLEDKLAKLFGHKVRPHVFMRVIEHRIGNGPYASNYIKWQEASMAEAIKEGYWYVQNGVHHVNGSR
jgi:hypothetical protein